MKTSIDQCNACKTLRTAPTPNDGWVQVGPLSSNVIACPDDAKLSVADFAAKAAALAVASAPSSAVPRPAALRAPASNNFIPFKYPNGNLGRLDMPAGATFVALTSPSSGPIQAQIKLASGDSSTLPWPQGAVLLTPVSIPAPAPAAPIS